MRLLTGKEMKRIDSWAEERGIPSRILMENAGRSVAQEVNGILKEIKNKKIVLLVGKGNNGGDALVAARHLHQMGADVKIFLLFAPENFQGATQENWELLLNLDIKWQLLEDDNSIYLLKLTTNSCDMIIDGIYGTGLKGEPSEHIARVIKCVNESNAPTIAIDIPSGVSADTGGLSQANIKAQYTVSFAWPKRGHVLYPGKKYVGQLMINDISIPHEGLELLEEQSYYLTRDFVKELLPIRDIEGYKNVFGHVLVIAGSRGMLGASLLASKATLRTGAGMVSTCLPNSLADIFDVSFPEALTYGLEEDIDKTIDSSAWSKIEQLLPDRNSIVFGPGLGVKADVAEVLTQLIEYAKVPVLIDADGLNVLAQNTEILNKAKVPIVLTPHPKEMARLLGISTKEVQDNRVEVAQKAALKLNAIVVLKGAATVIATPQQDIYINSTGSDALSTAGTGDVLAGTIGALLSQNMDAITAAILGVYLHGLAGDIVAADKGSAGVIASDVLEYLPYARKSLEN